MAQYLPRSGWEPVFVAPENEYPGQVPRRDPGLLKMVDQFPIYRIPFFQPFNNQSLSLVSRVVRRLWETAFFPDARIVWTTAVKKRLSQIVLKEKPDLCFITAAPFSSFLLGPYVKKTFRLPVILDYRDPWTRNPGIVRNSIKARLASPLEKHCVAAADLITAASFRMIDFIREGLGSIAGRKAFFGFPYGYDADPLDSQSQQTQPRGHPRRKVLLTFAGSVHGEIRAATILAGLQLALRDSERVRKNLQIDCYGSLFGVFKQSKELVTKYGLEEHVTLHPFLPYSDFLKVLSRSSFLLLPHGKGPVTRVQYPTKFFDYLKAKRPILYIGEKGQVSETITSCNAGIIAEPHTEAIAKAIVSICNGQRQNDWYSGKSHYEKLSRTNIFSGFAEKLNRLCRESQNRQRT